MCQHTFIVTFGTRGDHASWRHSEGAEEEDLEEVVLREQTYMVCVSRDKV